MRCLASSDTVRWQKQSRRANIVEAACSAESVLPEQLNCQSRLDSRQQLRCESQRESAVAVEHKGQTLENRDSFCLAVSRAWRASRWAWAVGATL